MSEAEPNILDAPPEDAWLTVCDGCREWVTGIFHITLDGKALCIECAAKIGVPTGPVEKKKIPVGPPAPARSVCPVCGKPGVAQCQGCGESFCRSDWWKHSHQHDVPAPAPKNFGAPPAAKVVLEVPAMPQGHWCRFLPREACPICGHCGWCTVSPDGDLIRCMRVESDRPSEGRDGQRGWLHPIPDAAATVPSEKLQPYSVTGPKRSPGEWALLVKQQRSALSPDKLEKLSAKLGVTADSLKAFGIGWDAESGCYSFPMYDAARKVIGVRLRVPEPKDARRWICVRGSANGLFVPDDYMAQKGDPLLLPEGPTCAAAARDRGLRAVGRANSSAGLSMLADFLRGGMRQDAVVVGENDGPVWAMVPSPPPPAFPGFEGAVKCCRAIAADVNRLRCIIPPKPHKDLRDWVKDGEATLSDVAELVERARDIDAGWLMRAEQRLQQRRQEAVATFDRMVERIIRYESGSDIDYARAGRIRAWFVRRGWPLEVRAAA